MTVVNIVVLRKLFRIYTHIFGHCMERQHVHGGLIYLVYKVFGRHDMVLSARRIDGERLPFGPAVAVLNNISPIKQVIQARISFPSPPRAIVQPS